MAKLYWRLKRNGKWTWSAAHLVPALSTENYVMVKNLPDDSKQSSLDLTLSGTDQSSIEQTGKPERVEQSESPQESRKRARLALFADRSDLLTVDSTTLSESGGESE